MAQVYLDWNATAPPRPEALAVWQQMQERCWANPASTHRAGQEARLAWDQELARLADLLGARPHELVLTSGGTEALNGAIRGILQRDGAGEVIASRIDHSAVLRCLQRHPAAVLRLLGVDGAGRLDPAALAAAIDEHSRLVCLQWANNEIGTIQPVAELVAAVREARPGLPILVDACQVAGKLAIDCDELDVDLLAIAGHKFGAPKGTGLLWVRSGMAMPALLDGGRQQEDRRSGSVDLAGLASLAAAYSTAEAERPTEAERQGQLIDRLADHLQRTLPELLLVGAGTDRLPNTLNVAVPDRDARALVTRLDLAGFAVSVGSACMARFDEPSHVIAALDLPPAYRRGALRISIGHLTTAAELERFAIAYVEQVRAMTSQR